MLKSKKKLILNLLLIIGLAILICFLKKSSLFKNCSVSLLKEYIKSYGMVAPIVYIVMFTFVPLTLFPDSILAISGGMVFGMIWGTLYTIIGALFGAVLSFYISRILGRSVVSKIVKNKGRYFEEGVEKKGFILILILRLIPLIPFDVISYLAGLSKIKFKDFILGTAIGIIPGILIFINIGDKSLNFKSIEFIISLILLIGLLVISLIIKKKISFNKVQQHLINKEGKNG
ncbi:TVP38/TMEM64 family protein [Clostridium oceanicum]|uniref:TVP38/TMEM64 family membrane protein n=1 Tax=Clostridium oceanicum TaxID=1543 RepID=A0ABN1JSV2_9CLOT